MTHTLRRDPRPAEAEREYLFLRSYGQPFAEKHGGNDAQPYGTGGEVTSDRGYVFTGQNGLCLPNALSDPAHYTIALLCQLDALAAGGFSKVMDFKSLTSDNGLYLIDDRRLDFALDIGETFSAQDSLPRGVSSLIVLTRDTATHAVHLFINGVLQAFFIDAAGECTFTTSDVILFQDDGITDTAAGACTYVGVWHRPLTAAEVANL